MNAFKKEKIINSYLNVINLKNFLETIKKFSISGKGHYICVSNVHQCIEAQDNSKFAEVINNADLVIPDGRPIYWALKLLGHNNAEHLPGYYITKKICQFAAEDNLKVGFYGGESDALDLCVLNLKNNHEKLIVNYVYSPPYRILTIEEKKQIINNIRDSNVQILFVCLGCPKQENWMAEHRNHLKCVSVGIGEAVNLISKKQKLAPKWVEKIGMRWVTRLIIEPKRLFWRYFYTNSKFVFLFIKQYIKLKFKV